MENSPKIYIEHNSGCGGAALGLIGGCAVGGVGLPIVGFFKLGFGWGLVATIPSALLGGGVGAVLGALTLGYAASRIDDHDIKLDQEALDAGVPHVGITYQNDYVR